MRHVGHFGSARSWGGTDWRAQPSLWSHRGMPPAAVLGEIWGTRRGDNFDQSCYPS